MHRVEQIWGTAIGVDVVQNAVLSLLEKTPVNHAFKVADVTRKPYLTALGKKG
jgi:hypothetical protein